MFSSTKYIGGHEVKPGLRITAPAHRDRFAFTIAAVCESAVPERWHGEVSFAGTTLISTDPVAGYDQAVRAAETVLTNRVVELFSR